MRNKQRVGFEPAQTKSREFQTSRGGMGVESHFKQHGGVGARYRGPHGP